MIEPVRELSLFTPFQPVSNLGLGLIRKSLLKDVNVGDDMDGAEKGQRLGQVEAEVRHKLQNVGGTELFLQANNVMYSQQVRL